MYLIFRMFLLIQLTLENVWPLEDGLINLHDLSWHRQPWPFVHSFLVLIIYFILFTDSFFNIFTYSRLHYYFEDHDFKLKCLPVGQKPSAAQAHRVWQVLVCWTIWQVGFSYQSNFSYPVEHFQLMINSWDLWYWKEYWSAKAPKEHWGHLMAVINRY